MGASLRSSWGSAPGALPRSAAIVLTSCLGYSGLLSMPMWVAPVGAKLGLTTFAMGSIASAELAAAGLVSLCASRVLGGYRTRWGAALGLLLIGLGNVGSAAAGGPAALVVARIASGLGEGLALTFVNASIATSEDPGRYFAWSQIGLNLFFLGLFYLATMSWAVGRFGPMAVFLLVGGAAFPVIGLAGKLPVGRPPQRALVTGASATSGVSSLAGLAIVFLGCQGAWAFLVAAGVIKGFTTDAIAHWLMVSVGIGLAGPIAARAAGRRCGWVAVVVLGLLISGLAVLVATQPVPAGLYVLGAAGFNFATLTILTGYQSHLAVVDSSGRTVAAAPSAINLGAAIGPAAVGMLWHDAGPRLTGWLIIACYGMGACLLTGGERLRKLLDRRGALALQVAGRAPIRKR